MSIDATPETEPVLSLNTVRECIPDECYERPTGRAVRALTRGVLVYGITVGALVVVDAWWAVALLWLAAGLAVSGLFVLGHDASHGALLPSPRANRIVARWCMLPSLHVESAWDLGHNRIHHGYTTRQGFDFVWHPATPEEYRAMGRVTRLRHRIEWSWIGSGLYFGRTVWWEKMWRFTPEGKRRDVILRDKWMVGLAAGVVIAGLAVFGYFSGGIVTALWLPVKLVVVPFLLFIQIIGWTVYVHHVAPEIRWWPRREWSQYKGQMESTTVLETPRLINWLWFHNIFVHVPHHVDVRIPFHQLPRAAAAIEVAYPETVRRSRLSPWEYLHAARTCKLYDFERGTWLPYAAASAS